MYNISTCVTCLQASTNQCTNLKSCKCKLIIHSQSSSLLDCQTDFSTLLLCPFKFAITALPGFYTTVMQKVPAFYLSNNVKKNAKHRANFCQLLQFCSFVTTRASMFPAFLRTDTQFRRENEHTHGFA